MRILFSIIAIAFASNDAIAATSGANGQGGPTDDPEQAAAGDCFRFAVEALKIEAERRRQGKPLGDLPYHRENDALLRATRLRAKGKPGESLEILNPLVARYPHEIQSRDDRALTYDQLGRHQDAIGDLDEVIRCEPGNSAAWSRRASANLQVGRYEAAVRDAGEAIRLQPSHYDHLVRGGAYAALGRTEMAIREFDEAIRLRPEEAEPYFNRGVAYARLEQHQAAITNFGEVLRLQPKNARAHGNRAISYAKLGNRAAAAEDFRSCLDLEPATTRCRAELEKLEKGEVSD